MCTHYLLLCGKLMCPNRPCLVTPVGALTVIRTDTLFNDQACVRQTSLDHWATICQIARAQLPPEDPTRRTLENSGVLKNCEDLLRVFDPVANALNSMQKNTTTLGEAVELWVDLVQKNPKAEAQANITREGIRIFVLRATKLLGRHLGGTLHHEKGGLGPSMSPMPRLSLNPLLRQIALPCPLVPVTNVLRRNGDQAHLPTEKKVSGTCRTGIPPHLPQT